ncbi:MAG TPA: transposase [Cyclobacteriaceae bacterium]|nr:transposase [Cyclobacteriaceae bacterium]
MENLTAEYIFRAEAWLLITTLIYFIMNGAGIFETAVIIPKWTASPPDSLQIFKGEYGIDLKIFWIVMHSVHEITFIVAIVFCWQIEGVREMLLVLFGVHFAVRVWTLAYFAPSVMEFQKIANTGETVPGLIERTMRWKNLNYVRTAAFIGVSIGMVAVYLRVLGL